MSHTTEGSKLYPMITMRIAKSIRGIIWADVIMMGLIQRLAYQKRGPVNYRYSLFPVLIH